MISYEASTYEKDKSFEMFQQAEAFIPGGVTANIKHFTPYPIFMKEGNGSKLIDVDNLEYIDYSLCYGALITGHGHPKIMEATIKQMQQSGTIIFGTPHELEITMAKKLNELYPSMEQVRFTNSGTEAVLLAIRLAIAHTNKQKVAKSEGHHHGGLNQVLVSVNHSEEAAGDAKSPYAVITSFGIYVVHHHQVHILPSYL